ncbi:MAG: UvrD-helicase domain-containing protein, partial [Thermovirgaceae bacterium]
MAKQNEPGILAKHLKETVRMEEDQIRAVTSGKKLVVVTAGAGTGKTLTLAWRFLWLVAAEGVPVDALLTITFTEKAALEMRERIKRLMESLLVEEPSLSHRLRPALDRLDEAYISTIHAFSMRVLKENALALDLDPEARVISGSEDTAFWLQLEHVLDRTDFDVLLQGLKGEWASRGEKTFSDDSFLDLLNTFGPSGITSFIRDFISHFASRGLTPEDIWAWSVSPETADENVAASLQERYQKEWREALSLWLDRIVPFVDSEIGLDTDKTKFSSRLRELRDTWKERRGDEKDLPRFIMALFDEKGPLYALNNGRAKKAAESILMEATGQRCVTYRNVRDHWLSVARFVSDGFFASEERARKLLLGACAVCWRFRDSQNHARGILTFDDLIRYASLALKTNSSYRSRFSHVLVDEFQDTDGLQYGMIRTISQDDECDLFLVGDLQQSIYRFRHAEPLIFWKVLSEARRESEGEEIILGTSFRSRGGLMDHVNRLFSSVWNDRIAEGIPRPYEPLFPPSHHSWWKERQGGTVPVTRCIVSVPGAGSESVPIEELRRTSLEALAEFLDDALTGGKTIWDPAGGGLRPLRFRDVAILVPTRTQYEALEEVLIEGRDFPVYFEGNRNYFSRGEVRDVAAALKAMADPDDNLALASFLSSPLSGLFLSEATSLFTSGEGKDLPGSLFARFASHYPEQARRLLSWRLKARVFGPSSLVAG